MLPDDVYSRMKAENIRKWQERMDKDGYRKIMIREDR